MLVVHPAVVVFPGEADQWRALADMCDLVGRYDAASAALAAIDAGTVILTRQSTLYAGIDPGRLTISITDEW